MYLTKILRLLVALFVINLSIASNLRAESSSGDESPDWMSEYSRLSLRELVEMEVTSPSKKREKVSDVASAVFVLTEQDIRRSGANTVPELLRLVPGMNVAAVDKSQWAVSARGFNGLFSDKLLVLIDGRTVYTPLFGGVFWNEHDIMLEDVKQIEVIRGPGATIWGANAVNGVINIITKSAEETQGTLVSAGGGTEERAQAAMRYGGRSGEVNYRGYVKAFSRDDSKLDAGGRAHDEWQGAKAGFRTDTLLGESDNLTVQGDVFYGESGWDLNLPDLTSYVSMPDVTRYYNGTNLLSRWTRTFSEQSDLSVQLYYDHIGRNDQVLEQRRDTVDFEAQHRFSPVDGHDLVYGVGSRIYWDDIQDADYFNVSVSPSNKTVNLYTGFIQDEITLVEDTLRLIAGAKVEHNEFSDWEFMPSLRLIATPNERHSVWAAVSRAVRSPTRFNNDGRLVLQAFPGDMGLTNIVTLSGDENYDAEDLVAYEAGYRGRLADELSIDAALFYNMYDNLESTEPAGAPFVGGSSTMPFVEIPLIVDNKLEGDTYGGEITLDYRPTEDLRFVAWYALVAIDLRRTAGSLDEIYIGGENQTPRHQAHLRTSIDLPRNLELDLMLRYVDQISTFNVDDYVELDARLGWHATKDLELAVVGQNLLDNGHVEFASNLVDTELTQVQRGVFAKVNWKMP